MALVLPHREQGRPARIHGGGGVVAAARAEQAPEGEAGSASDAQPIRREPRHDEHRPPGALADEVKGSDARHLDMLAVEEAVVMSV